MPVNSLINSLMINVTLFSCSSTAAAHPHVCDYETGRHEEETKIMLSVSEPYQIRKT